MVAFLFIADSIAPGAEEVGFAGDGDGFADSEALGEVLCVAAVDGVAAEVAPGRRRRRRRSGSRCR